MRTQVSPCGVAIVLGFILFALCGVLLDRSVARHREAIENPGSHSRTASERGRRVLRLFTIWKRVGTVVWLGSVLLMWLLC